MGVLFGVGDFGLEDLLIAAQNAEQNAVDAKEQALLAAQSISTGKDQGPWNPGVNTPTLTASSASFPDNAFFTISDTGKAPFAGTNFAANSDLPSGGQLAKIGSQWYLRKPSDAGYVKAVALEPVVASNDKTIKKLNPTNSYTVRSQQVGTYNLTAYTIAPQKEQQSFLFGKSFAEYPNGKPINSIGVMLFKRSDAGTISTPTYVQILHEIAGSPVVTKVIKSVVISVSDMQKYSLASVVNFRDLEYFVDLDEMLYLKNNDRLFISVWNDGGLHPIYTDTNKNVSTGEWNDSSGQNWRRWSTAGTPMPTYTTIPALPGSAQANPNFISLYEKSIEVQRVKSIEDRLAVAETSTNTNSTAIGGLQTSSSTNTTKIATLETKSATSEAIQSQLNPASEYPLRITQSTSYAYTRYNVVQKEQRSWWYGKSAKSIRAIGVFLQKRPSEGAIENPTRVQVLHKRGTTITSLVDATVSVADMQKYAVEAVSDYRTMEQFFDFKAGIDLVADDQLFISVFNTGGLTPVYYNGPNKNDVAGEWTDNSGFNYRSWINTTTVATYSDIPTRPGSDSGNTHALHFYDKTIGLKRLSDLETRVATLEVPKISLTLFSPPRVYVVANDIQVGGTYALRNYAASMYLDHFITLASPRRVRWSLTNNDHVKFFSPAYTQDGATVINGNSNVLKTNRTLTATGEIVDVSATIEQVSTKATIGAATPAFYHEIGDSNTDGTGASAVMGIPNGPNRGYDYARMYFEMDWIDAGKPVDGNGLPNQFRYLAVGSRNLRTFAVSYKSETINNIRSSAHGIGGWAAVDYCLYTDRRSNISQGVWDLLGLGNGTGTDYTGTDQQRTLAFTTYEGKYPPVNTPAFLSYMQSTYSGSGITDYASAVARLNQLQTNPNNPYFNKDLPGTYKFDFALYMSRRKTVANDGVTRLVVGSTAGSWVTSGTLNSYDLCDPTHTNIKLGTNDPSLTTVYLPAIQAMIASLKAYKPNMFIAVSCPDGTGSYFPELYPEFDPALNMASSPYAGMHNKGRFMNEQLVTLNNEANRIFYLPFYFVQPTALGTPFRSVNMPEFLSYPLERHQFVSSWTGFPESHPNSAAHAAWGYQIYAWIKYTLSL